MKTSATLRTLTVAVTGVALAALTPAAARAAGPISTADRDFIAHVHTAASYAASASELAQTTSGDGAVRTIGKKILEQDRKLDSLARDAAAKLQTPLPTATPTLDDLRAAPDFDTGYIDRLRTTGGALLEQAASIRVHTRNDIVRDLAQRTTTTMAAQLPLLESSGLVDFLALPAATTPAPATTTGPGPSADPAMLAGARHRDGFLWPSVPANLVVLGTALLIAAMATRRVFRRRR